VELSSKTTGKPLSILDFVSRLCPREEEKVICEDSKLLLTLGQRNKQKLSSISVEQYNIANIKIFYDLWTSNRLPSHSDVRDYLAYSIKVLELARK